MPTSPFPPTEPRDTEPRDTESRNTAPRDTKPRDTGTRDTGKPLPKRTRGDSPASTTSPKRTRGGQPGNKNSLKHGFYAIPTEVLSRLQTDAKGEGVDEIELLQSLIDDTVKIYRATPNKNLEQSQTTLRCVSQAVDSIKGQRLMQGALYSNQTTIEKALDELASLPPEED